MRKNWRFVSACIIILLLLYPTACSKTKDNQENKNTMQNTKDTDISTNPTKDEKVSGNTDTTEKETSADQGEIADQSKDTAKSNKVTPKPEQPKSKSDASKEIKPYHDFRVYNKDVLLKAGEYNVEDMYTYQFDTKVTFEGNEDYQNEIMEQGKNPGLGICDLHKEGITGKGVNVAIIDQNMFTDHPEFNGKIEEYYDTGCENPNGSMHGPAVTSILVGSTMGVAPDAKVYYAAVPSWKLDSEYYAKGLYWIIDKNKDLPADQKIRVVSVSASPSGKGSSFKKNTEMWDEALEAAEAEGILVIDCRGGEKTAIIFPAMYDRDNPEDISLCQGGFPTSKEAVPSTFIGVPVAYRTVALEYHKGVFIYQYDGEAGLSWGIPYASGVLALGWQVNPALDKDQIVQLLFDTCSPGIDGSNMINPPAFIEAVKKTL